MFSWYTVSVLLVHGKCTDRFSPRIHISTNDENVLFIKHPEAVVSDTLSMFEPFKNVFLCLVQ